MKKKDLSSVFLACFFRIRLCNFTPTALSRSVTRQCLNVFPQICLVDSRIHCIASKSYECINMNGTAKSLVYCSRTQRDRVHLRGGQSHAEDRIRESSIKEPPRIKNQKKKSTSGEYQKAGETDAVCT